MYKEVWRDLSVFCWKHLLFFSALFQNLDTVLSKNNKLLDSVDVSFWIILLSSTGQERFFLIKS